MKILVMGLPDAGKTTFADKLAAWYAAEGYSVIRYNADRVRTLANDWDFSISGRLRQAERLRKMADSEDVPIVIVDFVAALPEQRSIFDADYTIWIDIATGCNYPDTAAAFVPPTEYDDRITSWTMR